MVLFGKQWIYENRFVLDLSGELGVFKNHSTPEIIYLYYGDKEKLGYNKVSVSPNFNFKLGYLFW